MPNPTTNGSPSTGGRSSGSSFSEQMNAGANQALSNNLTPEKLSHAGQTGYFSADAVDPFSSQKWFQEDGFNAADLQGNLRNAAQMEDWGSTLDKSFDDFGYKFRNSFGEYWSSYGRMAKSLWNMDLSQMDLSPDDKLQQYYQDNLNEQRNRIFLAPEDEDSFFNKQLVKDFVGNSGFALGTFAGMGLEIAADIALEGLTAGGATPLVAADLAEGAAHAGGFVQGLKNFGKGLSTAGKSVDEIRAATLGVETVDKARKLASLDRASQTGRKTFENIWKVISRDITDVERTKALYEAGGKLMRNLPVVGTAVQFGEKAVAAGRAGRSAAEVAGISFQGFRRTLAELNMAASEAAFESVTTYGDTLDRMVERYRADHDGDAPDGVELAQMREYAQSASYANYNTNLGLLLASNKLEFGNLFSKFVPANRLVREFTEEASESVLTVAAKGETKHYLKGVLGTYGLGKQIADDFGKKEAVWQLSKSFLKDFATMEASEGVQENLQETSAAGWRDYYAAAYSKDERSLLHTMQDGLNEQFSQQGLKTFMLGAFTGAMIRVPTAIGQASFKGLQEGVHRARFGKDTPSPLQDFRQQLRQDLKAQNEFYEKPLRELFDDKQLNFKQQQQASAQATEAAREGKAYEFHNAKENAFLAAARKAKRTNTVDAFVAQVRTMGEAFSPEEFKEAFGFDVSETSHKSVAGLANQIADDLNTYVETIDAVKRRMGPTVDPFLFEKGSKSQHQALWLQNAVEDAVELVALNKIKGNMAAERAVQVSQDLLQVPGLRNASNFAIQTLANYENHFGELGLTEQEIDSTQTALAGLDDQHDPALRKPLEEKLERLQEKMRLLNEWDYYFDATPLDEDGNSNREPRFIGKDGDLKHADVIKTFEQLVNLKNADAGMASEKVRYEDLHDGFDKVVDYMRLSDDSKKYLRAQETLLAPSSFLAGLTRMADGKFKMQLGQFLAEKLGLTALHLQMAGVLSEAQIAEVDQAIRSSEPYRQLQVIYHAEGLGYEQWDRSQELKKQVNKVVEDTLAAMTGTPAADTTDTTTAPDATDSSDSGDTTDDSDEGAVPAAADSFPAGDTVDLSPVVSTPGPVVVNSAPEPTQTAPVTPSKPQRAKRQLSEEDRIRREIEDERSEGDVFADPVAAPLGQHFSYQNKVWKKTKTGKDNLMFTLVGGAKRTNLTLKYDVARKASQAGTLVAIDAPDSSDTSDTQAVPVTPEVTDAAPAPDAPVFFPNQVSVNSVESDAPLFSAPEPEAAPVGVAQQAAEFNESDTGSSMLRAALGLPEETAPEPAAEPALEVREGEPFQVEGDEQGGFKVTDSLDNTVAESDKEEPMEQLAAALIDVRQELDMFQIELGPELSKDEALVARFRKKFEQARRDYNKEKGLKGKERIATAHEFADTIDGQARLDEIRQQLTGTPTVQEARKNIRRKTSTTTGQAVINFDTAPTREGVGFTTQSARDLHQTILQITKIVGEGLQNTRKTSNFVEQKKPSADDIYKMLDDLTSCNQ